MTQEQALKYLQNANQIITLLNPLLGGAIALGTMIVNDVRAQGANVGPFAEEIAKFDAAVSEGLAADDAWRAHHGLPPAGTQQGSASTTIVTGQSTTTRASGDATTIPPLNPPSSFD